MGPLSARALPASRARRSTTPGVAVQLIGDGVHVSERAPPRGVRGGARGVAASSATRSPPRVSGGGRLPPRRGSTIEVSGRRGPPTARRRPRGQHRSARRRPRAARLTQDSGRADAIAAVTERPGRLVAGAGRLEPGGRADVLVVDDRLVTVAPGLRSQWPPSRRTLVPRERHQGAGAGGALPGEIREQPGVLRPPRRPPRPASTRQRPSCAVGASA